MALVRAGMEGVDGMHAGQSQGVDGMHAGQSQGVVGRMSEHFPSAKWYTDDNAVQLSSSG